MNGVFHVAGGEDGLAGTDQVQYDDDAIFNCDDQHDNYDNDD